MRTFAAAALVSILAATPAHAQVELGLILGQISRNMDANQAGEQCLLGATRLSDRDVASAQDGAMTTMTTYITSASASSSANVSRSFSRDHRQQTWIANDVPGNVRSVSDPLASRFASSGVINIPAPDAFIRSGDEATAEALWVLRDPSDASRVVGSYLARFRHDLLRGWLFTRLNISTSADALPTPTPYCHDDNDVAPPKEKPAVNASASGVETPAGQEQTPQSPAAPTPQ